jgi:uncharacterized protein YjlB
MGMKITNSDIEEHYEYCILLEPNLYKQAVEWCEKKCGKSQTADHWTLRRWFTSGSWNDNLYYYHFYFKISEDAVQFALRWK